MHLRNETSRFTLTSRHVPVAEKKDRTLTIIRDRFLALGYQSIRTKWVSDRRDTWLRSTADSAKPAVIISLDYKPTWRAYGVALGVVQDDIIARVRSLLDEPRIKPLLTSWRSARAIDAPCWNLFDAGRALDWKYLMLPDPDNELSLERELERVRVDLLESVFEKVTDDLTYAQLLLRSEKPFEWWITDPVLRAGEVIVALRRSSYPAQEVVSALAKFRGEIERALGQQCNFEEFVGGLLAEDRGQVLH